MKTTNIFLRNFALLFILFSTTYCQKNPELVTFATGFIKPVEITHAGDSRIFVVEQDGKILIIDSEGNINPQPFLDITATVKSTGNEQGLLGLAFDPGYAGNGYFYVNYTDQNDNTHIARFSVSETNPDVGDVTSEKTLLVVTQPFGNHNGGHLAFGPDGYLYIGLGDGGSAGDPGNRAQNLNVYLGKMLRIDVDNGDPYAIPPDNPFVGDTSARGEIWAYGLRNPWRFSFDRQTGDLWIGDVGQNSIEEIDFQPASISGGENYGWRCYEGNQAFNTTGCGSQEDYVFPIHQYTHSDGCSVTGGYIYRGSQISELQGYYFYADYCSDYIWTLHKEGNEWVNEQFGQFSGNNFSTFGEDVNGELYVAGHTTGTIYKLVNSSSGINASKKTADLKTYPNPFHNFIHIRTTIGDQSPVAMTVSDLQGKVVFHSEITETESTFNLQFLKEGIYFLKLKFLDGLVYSKLIRR